MSAVTLSKVENMVLLNDYLYSGNTVLKILHNYSVDLKRAAIKSHNSVDLTHSNFLIQIIGLLENNDFLTSQSQRIKDLNFPYQNYLKSLINP